MSVFWYNYCINTLKPKKLLMTLTLVLAIIAGYLMFALIHKNVRLLSETDTSMSAPKIGLEITNISSIPIEPTKPIDVLGITSVRIMPKVQIGGWIPAYDFQAGIDSVKSSKQKLFTVQYAGASVVLSGEVGYGTNFDQNLSTMNSLSIPFGLNLISTNFDGSTNFLKDKTRQDNIYLKLQTLKKTYPHFSSISVDFEKMHVDQKQPFNDFLTNLKIETSKIGIELYVTVFPRFDGDTNISETKQITDYSFIGGIADKVLIMGYDYPTVVGGIKGPYAPNSPNDWLDKVLKYSTAKIAKEKLILALPLYGYSFNKADTTPVIKSSYTYSQIQSIIKNEGLQPTLDGNFNEMYLDRPSERIYFQNQETLDLKKELALKHGVDKIFFWRIGRDGGIGY